MASVNSVLVAAAAAGVVCGAVGVLLVLSGSLEPDSVAPFSWFSEHLESVDALGGSGAVLAWILSIVAGVLGIAFALANLGSLAPPGHRLPLPSRTTTMGWSPWPDGRRKSTSRLPRGP